MDREENKLNTQEQEQEFSLEDILREFGGEQEAGDIPGDDGAENETPATEAQPLPEPAREVAPEPEESIETNIGDEVSAALAEQEQQKAAYKKELDIVRRRNRREQQKLDRAKKSAAAKEKREKTPEPVKPEPKHAKSPKVVKFSGEMADKAPVNPEGKKVVRRVPLHEIPKKEKTHEPAPDEALKQCRAGYGIMRIRCFAAFVICAAMWYLSIAAAFGLPCPKVQTLCSALLIGQVLVMALCADRLIFAVREVTRLRFGLNLVALLGNIITALDAAAFLVTKRGLSALPYCAVSATVLMLLLWSTALGKGACAKALKTIAGEERRMILTREDKLYMGHSVILKSSNSPDGFVSMCTAADAGKRSADILACAVFILSAAISGVIRAKTDGSDFLHLWACIMGVSLPLSSAVVYTLPFSKLTKNLRRIGAVLGGYRGAASLAGAAYLNITDHDLFAQGKVELNGMKLVGSGSEDVISYTAAMMNESGCCLAPAFDKLAKEHFGSRLSVDGFRMLEGGMEGRVQGDHVVCGTGEFMRINAIPLPKGTNVSSAVFTAINGELRGIFAITYNASEKTAEALDMLLESTVCPLVTSRDFNVTPAMIRAKFDVDTDNMEMPYVDNSERVINADVGGAPCAVITKAGLYPPAAAVLGAKKLVQVVRGNVLLMILGSIVAMALAAYLCFIGQTGTLVPGNVLLFMALWLIPALICSSGVTRY